MIGISESFIRCPKLAVDEETDTSMVEKLMSSATPPKPRFLEEIPADREKSNRETERVPTADDSRDDLQVTDLDADESADGPENKENREAARVNAAPGGRAPAKRKGCKVVKFEPSPSESVHRASAFLKVPVNQPVQPPRLVASSLTKEIVGGKLTSTLHGSSSPRSGPILVLKVFIAYTSQPPMKVKIRGECTVEEAVELIIQQHYAEERKPPLNRDPHAYELRMVDDDDGTPDEDMPALERTRDIHKFEVKAVALCESLSFVPRMRAASATLEVLNAASKRSTQNGDKFYIKVYMQDHESHILPVYGDMQVLELFPLLAKKKQVGQDVADFDPENYELLYLCDEFSSRKKPLDLHMTLKELQNDELIMLPINPSAGAPTDVKTAAPGANSSDPFLISFTQKKAQMYTEYRVIKTNKRGKRQNRVLGIDGVTLYNKMPDGNRRISKVKRPERPISDVVGAKILDSQVDGKRKCFQLLLRDEKQIESITFEADTEAECAEIVTKIEYLTGKRQLQDIPDEINSFVPPS